MHYVALVILNVNTLETCRKDINYSIDSLHKNILIPTAMAMAMMIMEAIMKMLHCLLTMLCGLLFIPRAKGTRILLFSTIPAVYIPFSSAILYFARTAGYLEVECAAVPKTVTPRANNQTHFFLMPYNYPYRNHMR